MGEIFEAGRGNFRATLSLYMEEERESERDTKVSSEQYGAITDLCTSLTLQTFWARPQSIVVYMFAKLVMNCAIPSW